MRTRSFSHNVARGTPSRLLVVCLLAAFALLAGPLRAEEAARPSSGTPLDATPSEIVKFYGPVLRANARVRNHQILDGSVFDGNLYGKNGLVIRVVYHKDRSVLLEYVRAVGPLSTADVNLLLASNAGSFAWETGKGSTETSKFYRRSDGRAIAHWTAANDGSLLVSAEDSVGSLGDGVIQ